MSNEIATYSMILSKLSLGKSGTECPTKTQILAINSLIVIENASTYGANECVKIDDIRKKVETWNYYLTVSPTSMSFGAGGGSKSFTVSSYKRKVLDGVEQSGDTNVSLKSTTISGTGFSLSGTTVSASANETTSNRTGTVTITQNESNRTATINVSQDAKPVTYNIIFTYELNGTVKQTLAWDVPTSSTTKTVSIPAPSGGWSSNDNISLALQPSLPNIGWTGNTQVGKPSQFEATGSLVITNNSSGITFTVIYSIEGIGNVFTFADGSTYKKYYSIKQGDTHTVSNLAPFISTVNGKEAGYVVGSSTAGIGVSIKTDNTVSIVTSANHTGQTRTLFQEYKQWNSGYTGESIRIEVEQAG